MNISAILLICGLLIVAVLLLFVPTPRSWRKASIPVDHHPARPIFRDDDRYWSGGLLYNNPDDPDLFVSKRFGIGWTLNFGHPQSKLVIIGTLLFPLILTLLGVLLTGSLHPNGCHPSGCN
ncbi:MAG TPA: DUF5808 domain-containing protein [Ktedonobacteraceae bacterium]|nr:DUF5808 domain-containing protein [Ktedonobacteraceae bacterium]